MSTILSEQYSHAATVAYAKYGSTVVSSALFSNARPTFWVSDAAALKTISNNRNTFRRDLEGVSYPVSTTFAWTYTVILV